MIFNSYPTAAALCGALVFIASCSKSPTVPPPTVVNAEPVIASLSAATERAEAGRPIPITAVVTDAESAIGAMTYTWSASPQAGLFSGTGPSVVWTPPTGQTTPSVYTITLAVTESYTSGGQARVNTVSRSTTVRYNDSDAEVKELAYDFLVRKFGVFTVTPAEAVANFSNSCSGKADEFEDVRDNRAEVRIISASFSSSAATFNTDRTAATVEGPCQFEDIPNSGPNAGRRQFVHGTCRLTAVYETFRWQLCTSSFNGIGVDLARLRGRVPGRPFVR